MNYTDLTQKLMEKALKMGADAAEIYLETGRSLSVNILNKEIETIEESTSSGIGVRVIVGGAVGFSFSNNFQSGALDETIASAIRFARLTTPADYNILAGQMPSTAVDGLYDPGIFKVSMEKKIEMALELEKLAMSDKRITKSAGSSYGEEDSEVFICNSNGILKSYKSSGCYIGVNVVAEKNDQKETGSESCSRRYFADLLSLDEVAAKASMNAWEMLDCRMVKTQKAPVIFDPDIARSLFGGVISALDGERVLKGASFLRDSLEKQIAMSQITIIDDGVSTRRLASAPFDAEGVPTQRRALIENGIVKGFIYNTSAAKRAGTASTGNASRGGYTSLPGIGTHNLILEPGTMKREEIISSTKRGLLLKGLTGYGIDPVTGNFSGGASGLWIENGEIAFPVEGITIAASADHILNSIDMIGNDIDLNRTFAAPTFRVAEMQIGGE